MMYWDKISEDILPVDFRPTNPKSNKSIVTIYWLINEDGKKQHLTSKLKGEFDDPFIINIEHIPKKQLTSIIYDRECMIPDKLYDCHIGNQRVGFILHDNIIKTLVGE